MRIKLEGNSICHGDFSGNSMKIAQFVEGKQGMTPLAKSAFVHTFNCGSMMLDCVDALGHSNNIGDVVDLLKELRVIHAIYKRSAGYSEEQSE